MTKSAIAGGVIMMTLGLIGLFGTVSLNGQIIENRLYAFATSFLVFPLFLIVLGFIFGSIKDALFAFFRETVLRSTRYGRSRSDAD